MEWLKRPGAAAKVMGSVLQAYPSISFRVEISGENAMTCGIMEKKPVLQGKQFPDLNMQNCRMLSCIRFAADIRYMDTRRYGSRSVRRTSKSCII